MKYTLLFAVGLVLFALPACRTAQMRVPDELSQANRLPVEGRQGWKVRERLRFGPYETLEVDRSWVRGKDFEYRAYESGDRNQRFSFVLAEAGQERLGGSCEASLRTRTLTTDIVDVALKNKSRLFCSFYPSRESARGWELQLEEAGDKPLKGRLNVDDRSYAVEGTRKLEGGLPAETTSGYTISRAGKVLAAVEVIGSGAVLIPAALDADEQTLLATTATALLLLEDLRGHLSSEVD